MTFQPPPGNQPQPGSQPPPPGNQPQPGGQQPPPPPGYQPQPPPPGGQPQPPQQQGQWNPPPGHQPGPGGPSGAGGFDPRSVNPLDWALMGIGGLLLIFSFFGYISVDAGPYSDSIGAWHFGSGQFVAWFAMVFSVLGGAAVALGVFAPQVKLSVPGRVAGLGLFGIGFILYLIAIFAHPEFGSSGSFSVGHGFSFWFSLILALAGTVLSLMRAQQANTALPGPLSKMPKIGK